MDEFLAAADLWLPGTLGMLVLIVLSGFFSGSETALFSLTHDEVRAFRLGPRRQRLVADLLADPDRVLTAILFCNLLINLLFFALSLIVANQLAAAKFPIAAGVYGFGSLLVIIVFGEVFPKSAAVIFPRVISQVVAIPMLLVTRVFDPVIPYFKKLTRAVRRAFWPDLQRETVLDTEDLEQAVEGSALSEDLRQQERVILGRILDLTEITAEEVMRPRGTFLAPMRKPSISQLRGRVPTEGCLLVGDGSGEERVVPLSALSAVPEQLETAAIDTVSVVWCAPLAMVAQELRTNPASVACVVDEHGATIGIITWQDVLETILLTNPSRTRRVLRREPVRPRDDGCYEVEGLTTLRFLSQRLGMEHEPDEEGITTVAGVMQEELDRMPAQGDSCMWRGWRFTVSEADKRGHLVAVICKGDDA